MKSLPLERVMNGRRYSGDDDNPFDLLYSPSAKIRRSDTFGMLASDGPAGRKEHGVMDAMAYREPADETENKWKPSLIKFQRQESERSSCSSSSSTPGSTGSEASFEGGAPEDYLRVYGPESRSHAVNPPQDSPFSISSYLQPSPLFHRPPIPQALAASAYIPNGHDGTSTNVDAPSLYTPPPSGSGLKVEYRLSAASTLTASSTSSTLSALSTASDSTITSLTSIHTSQTAQTARSARPSLVRPRPRAHPYDPSVPASGSASGPSTGPGAGYGIGGPTRTRENSGGDGRGMSFGMERQSMRDAGRTVSEEMMAMAGLRCQKGRSVKPIRR